MHRGAAHRDPPEATLGLAGAHSSPAPGARVTPSASPPKAEAQQGGSAQASEDGHWGCRAAPQALPGTAGDAQLQHRVRNQRSQGCAPFPGRHLAGTRGLCLSLNAHGSTLATATARHQCRMGQSILQSHAAGHQPLQEETWHPFVFLCFSH